MSCKKTLQVPVIVGEGDAQFFVESDTNIAPPSPPVYKIISVEHSVDVYTAKVIKGKVLFNAYLCKIVTYSTVEHLHDGTVNGPVYFSSFKVPFGGFVELATYPGEKICEGADPELLEAEVEGSKDILHDQVCVNGVKAYNKLLEKVVVRLKFKATVKQHIEVEAGDHPKPPKPEKPCDKKPDPCDCKDEYLPYK